MVMVMPKPFHFRRRNSTSETHPFLPFLALFAIFAFVKKV